MFLLGLPLSPLYTIYEEIIYRTMNSAYLNPTSAFFYWVNITARARLEYSWECRQRLYTDTPPCFLSKCLKSVSISAGPLIVTVSGWAVVIFSTVLFSRVPSQKAGCRRAWGHITLVSSPWARVWQEEMELQNVGHGRKDGLLFLRGETKTAGGWPDITGDSGGIEKMGGMMVTWSRRKEFLNKISEII